MQVTDRLTVVLDIGKTTAKLSLWTASGDQIARASAVNDVIHTPSYRALDTAGIEHWLADTLADFARQGNIAAIIPVGHGAAAAIVRDGKLLFPPIDYESPVPDAVRLRYARERPPFAETGSPALADGLNLGLQLAWLEDLHPGCLRAGATILPWPQYWAWLLSGVAACEVTSLGCHSDLWNPVEHRPSSMAVSRGWASALPVRHHAGAILDHVSKTWADRTGMPADVNIHCGLHDSNAAFIAARGNAVPKDREITVLSTGTWFVAMRSVTASAGIDVAALATMHDCLINVDPDGNMLPSARFMGGREIDRLTVTDGMRIDVASDQQRLLAAAADVLASGARVLPCLAPGSGPFPDHHGEWVNKPVGSDEARAAVALYAALVADVVLDRIGAPSSILVEGRFARCDVFVQALAALRPASEIWRADSESDVSFGALRVLDPALCRGARPTRVLPLAGPVARYAAAWHRDIEQSVLPR